MTKYYICKQCGKHFLEWRNLTILKNNKEPTFCSKSCKAKYAAKSVKKHICNFPKKACRKVEWKCNYCEKSFKTRKELYDHKHEIHNIGKVWNKGLTKETDERIKKASESLKNTLNEKYNKYGWKVDPNIVEKARLKQIEHYKNYPRQMNPRGKSGWYKKIWCDSSWELAYILWCEKNNIKIKRCLFTLPYNYKGKLHYYSPDFIINDNEIIEIKGYFSEKDKIKAQTYPNIKVYFYKDLKFILDWVKEEYGNDFIKLYDKINS